MIYTLTLAPAIDCVQRVKDFKRGGLNRGYRGEMEPGGKGINVSIVLKRLGLDSVATGFAGGFVGTYLLESLKHEGVTNRFIMVGENSRINFKILSDDGSETQVNGAGPFIPPDKMEELFGELSSVEDGDVLVLVGQVPQSFKETVYADIVRRIGKKVSIVADAIGALLTNLLPLHPFLVKPNLPELCDILGLPLRTEKEIVEGAKELKKRGAKNVIVSRGRNGAVMVDERGKVYVKKTLPEKAVSSFGSGDALVAGFLCGYQLYGDYEKALDLAVATGTARALTGHHPTKEEVIGYLNQLSPGA